MALLRFLMTSTFVCLLGACSVEPAAPDDPGTLPEPGENGGAGGMAQRNVAGSKHSAQAGRAGHAGAPLGIAGEDGGMADPSGGAGGRDDAGDAAPPKSCDLNGSCISKCENSTATCGIVSTGAFCELEGFTGATAQVACGQRVVIGTACCGGCGCVPVEVFFDGKHCWEGMPQCKGLELDNRMLFPHPPTVPNPSYTPPATAPGAFYLGSGGFGGREGAVENEATGGNTAKGGSGGTSNSAAGVGSESGSAGTICGAAAGQGGGAAGNGGATDNGGAADNGGTAGNGGAAGDGGAAGEGAAREAPIAATFSL